MPKNKLWRCVRETVCGWKETSGGIGGGAGKSRYYSYHNGHLGRKVGTQTRALHIRLFSNRPCSLCDWLIMQLTTKTTVARGARGPVKTSGHRFPWSRTFLHSSLKTEFKIQRLQNAFFKAPAWNNGPLFCVFLKTPLE